MTDVRTHTRRPPQPPIDPALVVPGSRWQKNRAEHLGKPPVFDIVDSLEPDVDVDGIQTVRVHYHSSDTGRRGDTLLRAFVKGSEHKMPDTEPDPPVIQTPARPDDAPATVADVRALAAKVDALLQLARARSAGPLFDKAGAL